MLYRFKKFDDITYDLITELCGKISVQEWIETFKIKLKAKPLKNYFFAIIGLIMLSSCNEKPVVIEDPRNNPEQFRKVDTLSKELQILKQDSYLNDLDVNAGMEITSSRINMFYRSETDTINQYYDYVVDQKINGKSTAEEGISYLHLIQGNDSLHYEILKNDRSILRFKFLRDSTVHEYFPEHRPGVAPTVIPD